MKIRIVSDGTPSGTRIYNQDDDTEIKNVICLDIHLAVEDTYADVLLRVRNPELDLYGIQAKIEKN